MGIEETYLSIIKVIYNKHTGNIIFSGEKLKVFPLHSENHKTLMQETENNINKWEDIPSKCLGTPLYEMMRDQHPGRLLYVVALHPCSVTLCNLPQTLV